MVQSDEGVPALASDLSTYARIRNAALIGFGSNGVAATSIRSVAAAAGVSPGLVQHHFGTKVGLQDAVNEYVIAVSADAFQGMVGDGDDGADWTAIGDTATAWVRENVVALRYIARSLVDGDSESSRIFDALVEIARTNWLAPLSKNGALRPDTDQAWAAIHAVIFNLACVLLEPTISRQLSEPFFSPAQLQRWNTATTDLYRHGLTSPPAPRDPHDRP